jgi:hypothetical protein
MSPKKVPVWAHFTKFQEVYKETPTGETMSRTKALCAFGCPAFVYRNVDQFNNHLASHLEGLGKSSGCKYVTSTAPDVQAKCTADHASRAAGKAMKKNMEEHRSAILVRTHDLPPPTTLIYSPPRFTDARILPLHVPTPHLPSADLDLRLLTLSAGCLEQRRGRR